MQNNPIIEHKQTLKHAIAKVSDLARPNAENMAYEEFNSFKEEEKKYENEMSKRRLINKEAFAAFVKKYKSEYQN